MAQVSIDRRRQRDREYYVANRDRVLRRAKEYYEDNKVRVAARNKRYRQEIQAIAREAKSQPCMDCKQSWPVCVMQFHHRDPSTKKGDVCNRSTPASAHAELAKCDVICANCHLIRHEASTGKLPCTPT